MNNLKILITKLSLAARTALENSANFCMTQHHYEIEIEHFFHQLLSQNNRNDCVILLQKYKISVPVLVDELQHSIAQLPQGNQRSPIFSRSIVRLLEQAWLLASADQIPVIRTGHLLISLLTAPDLYQLAMRASSLFDLLPIDTLKHKFLDFCQHSDEQFNPSKPHHPSTPEPASSAATAKTSSTSAHDLATHLASHTARPNTQALDRYTINLTHKAQSGAIDPVIGREFEIRLMLDILMRRRQNNPILTGEPGVGKTALVEGLALKIVNNQVPDALKHVQIHLLDMGLLQAGASVKGEFENRLKNVIAEVQAAAHPIILFIDEAHNLIGAGGQAGQNDAANLLKPALARGELRTIAATTWAEYKQYFEKDAALSRRFQVVKVEAPTPAVAIEMLRAMLPVMKQHFDLHIDDEAIVSAVQGSDRYITARQLPDKAISVLDTAAARVALSQNAQPVRLDQLQAQHNNLQLEYQLIQQEHQQHPIHQQRLLDLKHKLDQISQQIKVTTLRWQQELELVKQMKQLQTQVSSNDPELALSSPDTLNSSTALSRLKAELRQLQGQDPLVHAQVNSQIVNQIISDWTGIPIGKMRSERIPQLLNLQQRLADRVMGQDAALSQLVQGITIAKAKLEDPSKPQGVFLLLGPSGVGKTETALALADELYGGQSHLISINMSEYQEAHTVSSLKGAPPGYVGYGQGGVLTEAVRRNPYSVVLLDEIEKAHRDVHELFYQVFDKGTLEDGEGRIIDFKNTTILLTSNIGSGAIMQACLNQPLSDWPSMQALLDLIKPHLYQNFKPAFLGRMRVVPYYPLHDELLERIIEHKLNLIRTRLDTQYGIALDYAPALVALLLDRCTEVDSGARNIEHILNASVLPELATRILVALSEQNLPQKIYIDIDIDQDQICYQLQPQPSIDNQPASKTKSKNKAKNSVKSNVKSNIKNNVKNSV